MQIKMREPVTSRNIYVNPETNIVHILMPIVGGTEISTDNTCRSVTALKTFFGKYPTAKQNSGSVLNSLQSYKEALQDDILLLPEGNPQKLLKKERLKQINEYISALKAIKDASELDSLNGRDIENSRYPKAIQNILKTGVNMFSMVLHPADGIDDHLNSVDPVFSVNRKTNKVFFQAMFAGFSDLDIQPRQSFFSNYVQMFGELKIETEEDFRQLQKNLGEQLGVDLFISNEGIKVTKDYINQQMGDDGMTLDGYIDALINYCTKDLLQSLQDSPFSSLKNTDFIKLCFLTQFYLAEINIYCKSHGLTQSNFGRILDSNLQISELLVSRIKHAIENNASVESAIVNTINEYSSEFGLSEPINSQQIIEINARVERHFSLVKNMEQADEFMLNDSDVKGKFVTHQGSICVDFTELILTAFPKQTNSYFTQVNSEADNLEYYLANSNDSVYYEFTLGSDQVEAYFKNLIAGYQFHLLLRVFIENPEQVRRISQRTIFTIFNTVNTTGLNFLGYLAKNSPANFANFASLLTKQNLLICMSTKSKLGDTPLHAILNKPQNLQLVVAALPGDTLKLLLDVKNSHGETLLEAATNATSRQIALDGLSNSVDLIDNDKVDIEVEANEVKSDITTEQQPTQIFDNSEANLSQYFSNTSVEKIDETKSDTTEESSMSVASNISPSVQTGITFFTAEKPSKNKTNLQHLYLNSSPEDVIASGARNCFVWQSAKRRELVYIGADGEQNITQMPIHKAFAFQAELQKLTRKDNVSQDSRCNLEVKKDEMQELFAKASITAEVFVNAISGNSDGETDSETASDEGRSTPF